MSDLITQYNEVLHGKFAPLAKQGVRRFDFIGGRRSGKTWFILDVLLGRLLRGEVVNVATMTSEQGRLGSYADAVAIINGSPSVAPWLRVLSSPREIRCEANGGQMFFNSYPDPERAKGIACDWLYINEANNFSERQFIDLSASVRKGVFADRNPNSTCWTETNGFARIHSTWKDNAAHLTREQLDWFARLKAKAESPDATEVDRALYRMYYLGEYAEITGDIFTPANIQVVPSAPDGVTHIWAYCDPSALWGKDYFACVLSGVKDGIMYVLDVYSVNSGSRDDVVHKLREWCTKYKDVTVCVETNGFIGQEFYAYVTGTFGRLTYVNQNKNKFDRIIANYENICSRVRFVECEALQPFLAQVYTFAKNCEHDDNIDAVDTSFSVHRWQGHL